jgi:hypothetical protein
LLQKLLETGHGYKYMQAYTQILSKIGFDTWKQRYVRRIHCTNLLGMVAIVWQDKQQTLFSHHFYKIRAKGDSPQKV